MTKKKVRKRAWCLPKIRRFVDFDMALNSLVEAGHQEAQDLGMCSPFGDCMPPEYFSRMEKLVGVAQEMANKQYGGWFCPWPSYEATMFGGAGISYYVAMPLQKPPGRERRLWRSSSGAAKHDYARYGSLEESLLQCEVLNAAMIRQREGEATVY